LLAATTYNSVNRLERSVKSSEGSSCNSRYTYDNTGNRISFTSDIKPTGSDIAYSYDAAGRLIYKDDCSYHHYKDYYEYDVNGNQTKVTTKELEQDDYYDTVYIVTNEFDYENRLTKSHGKKSESTTFEEWTEFIYNGDGQLIQSNTGPVKPFSTQFLYDGDQVIADLDAAGALITSYTRMPGGRLLSIYKYEGLIDGRDTYYIFTDNLGSTVLTLGKSNARMTTEAYDVIRRLYRRWRHPLYFHRRSVFFRPRSLPDGRTVL
jgi:hypothetical protein